MDRLAAFNAFIQAAETGSFTAASRQIGVTSSAIGKAISRLEERLGIRLFQRSTRSLVLTGEGTMLFQRYRHIMQEMEAVELELAQACSTPSGRLRVSMTVVTPKVMRRIADFARTYPDVDLELDCDEREMDLIEDGFDLALIAGDIADSGLITRTLDSFRRVLVASPEYLRRSGVPSSLADLSNHACLHQRVNGSRRLDPWLPNALDPMLEPAPFATSTSIQALVDLVRQGLGIACVPEFLIAPCVKGGNLLEVLPDETMACGSLRMVWGSNRQLSPKIKAFVEFVTSDRRLVGGGATARASAKWQASATGSYAQP